MGSEHPNQQKREKEREIELESSALESVKNGRISEEEKNIIGRSEG